jgi:hypothetical protein
MNRNKTYKAVRTLSLLQYFLRTRVYSGGDVTSFVALLTRVTGLRVVAFVTTRRGLQTHLKQ